MPKFCSTCQFWLFIFTRDKRFGQCDHPLIEGKVLIDTEHDPMEHETVMHTEENFGCIYHTPLHGNVVTKFEEDEKR